MLKRLGNWYIGMLRDTNPVTSYNDYQEGFADVIDVTVATFAFLFIIGVTAAQFWLFAFMASKAVM